MEIQTDQSTTELFESLMEVVRLNLLEAQADLDNWEALWKTTDKLSEIVDFYNGFFHTVRSALWCNFIIKANNVVSDRDDAPSLYRLLNLIEKNPYIALGLDASQLRRRLKKLRSIINRMESVRNRRAAHYDTEKQPNSVSMEQYHYLLEELQAVFLEIYQAHTGMRIGFEIWSPAGINQVLQHLDEYFVLRPLVDDVLSRIEQERKHPSENSALLDSKEVLVLRKFMWGWD